MNNTELIKNLQHALKHLSHNDINKEGFCTNNAHAERRRILGLIKDAESAGQYLIAADLLGRFQVVNQRVRDAQEYHPDEIGYEMAMMEMGE